MATVDNSTKLLDCPHLPLPEQCCNGGAVEDVLQELKYTNFYHPDSCHYKFLIIFVYRAAIRGAGNEDEDK